MTHGTIAGILITDLIMGRPNPWTEVYAPERKTLRAAGEFVGELGNNLRQYAKWAAPGDVAKREDIPLGAGAVIRRGMQPVAVYRDPAGAFHERSAVCTHLRCIVQWNTAEHTWDCPCHGSRFEPLGAVINGPATEPLPPVGTTPPPRPPRKRARVRQT
jgi:Rieske Fe-S protein